MKIKNLLFDGIDATSEIHLIGEKYHDIFLEMPNFQLESFLNGKKYLIYGIKGTGKSALINYIYQKEKENAILYSYDSIIDQNANNIGSIVNFADGKVFLDQNSYENNFEMGWELFIIRTIIYYAKIRSKNFIVKNREFYRLYNLLHSCYGNIFYQIIPRYKKGSFLVKELNRTFVTEFGHIQSINAKMYFNKIKELFYQLKFSNNEKLYILFDELNITFSKRMELKRQKEMISSLLGTISTMNKWFRDNEINIYIITSLRSEIKNMIFGMEVNKKVIDYGVELNWGKFTDSLENPLIKLMLKRFRKTDSSINSDDELWTKWFDIEKKEPKWWIDYILKHTWNKPRDIVTIFIKMKYKYGDKEIIDQKILRESIKDYCDEAYSEIFESVSIECDNDEIILIQKICNSLPKRFSFSEFIRVKNDIVERFSNEFGHKELKDNFKYLELMYKYGIIGLIDTRYKRSSIVFYYENQNKVVDNSMIFVFHPVLAMKKGNMKI